MKHVGVSSLAFSVTHPTVTVEAGSSNVFQHQIAQRDDFLLYASKKLLLVKCVRRVNIILTNLILKLP